MKIDELDENILGEMKLNKRLKLKELAVSIGVPISTIHYRINRLKKAGILNKAIEINWKKLGYNSIILLFIKLEEGNLNIENIKQYSFIDRVFKLVDDYNFMIILRARDMEEAKLNIEKIRKMLPKHSIKTVIADE